MTRPPGCVTVNVEKFLTVDPGEDTGWSIWNKWSLLESGTTKMWDFSDTLWAHALNRSEDAIDQVLYDELVSCAISHVVVENWALYPWKLQSMDWDECRTARLIGSIYQACRVARWDYEQQPAKIKERAQAAGAKNYFSHPLHENRHANDAIMHGVYRNALANGAPWTDLSKSEWTA